MRTSILGRTTTLAFLGRLRLLLVNLFVIFLSVHGSRAGTGHAELFVMQQTSFEVSGHVSDENGESLPGVNVLIENTTVGTVTDAEGNYLLHVSDRDATLVFSFIGYEKQEVMISGRTQINVSLAPDVLALEEVVVVGYGTQSREKLIGSVAQISGEKIAERPVSQLKNALTGQLPGVTITQRSGAPGVGSGRISIRGVGSFGASPDPLILVDGVPIENFNDIDPNSVESISVLKDASSSAIYGSRAANGVILVTTKTGKIGAPKISVHSYVAIRRLPGCPTM